MIELQQVWRTYTMGGRPLHALRDVTLRIARGEHVALVGPSCSGKSTMLHILGCLDRPTSGQYFLEGEEVSKFDKDKLARIRNQRIGFVFQSFNLLSRTTALENTELPLLYSATNGRDTTDRALEALVAVGLGDRAHHKTNQLSGGEQQRVAIARALLNNPSLILADEPTGNLDSRTSSEVMNIFKTLNEDKGMTIIMVTIHVVPIPREIMGPLSRTNITKRLTLFSHHHP